jgi:hypothetical protein
MANRKNKTNIRDERVEDVTMYGEFIPSFDQWIAPDNQKKITRHLEEVTSELAPDIEKNRKKKDRKAR